MGINIWPWVFNFTQAFEVGWNEFKALGDNLNERIIRHVSQCKFTLTHVTRISLPKYRMTKTRNNLK